MTNQPAKSHQNLQISRRRFLSVAGAAGAGVAMATLPFGQSVAHAQGDARSLVCVFLSGGADSANMFVPLGYGESGKDYGTYRATRGALAISQDSLIPFANGDFGFHPGLPGLAAIAQQNRLAVIQNVGPLARPTTRADVEAQRSLPETLFAHDAQAKLWQTARPTLTSSRGWGGSIGAAINGAADIAPAFSIGGSNIWQSAQGAPYTRLSPTVSIERLNGYDASTRSWIPSFGGVEEFLGQSIRLARQSGSALERAMGDSMEHAILTTERLQAATANSADNNVGMDEIGGNRLGLQLQMVARLIRNREALGMSRQVFFVRMGGWDTHGEQATRFPALLRQFDQALTSFNQGLDFLGVADSVTTFTASDFGRTLTSNGDGTDHGWGGHAFVMGGAVRPGTYGTFPSHAVVDNPDDTGDRRSNFAGRIIPTTAVAQYGATLARWMGLSETQLDRAFPELGNFASRDLGFLNS